MQLILRTAFALFVMTLLPVGAHAGDPSDSTKAEDKAITGDEGKNNPNKPGGGTSDAQSPGAENKAIQGGN